MLVLRRARASRADVSESNRHEENGATRAAAGDKERAKAVRLMASNHRVKITVVDHGYKVLMESVAGLSEPTSIAVGVLERDAQTEDGAVTVLDVGTWNEFGTVGIPSRSFIRDWVDGNRKRAQGILKKLLQRVIAGELTEDAALEQFGAWAKGEIQVRIARGVPPPNAASTVKRKGSSTPLIDTGILRSSIDYEVRK